MYVERPPSAGLAGRLACGWHRVSEAAFTQLVVPDACVDLIWGPDGLYVAGPDTGPMPAALGIGETLAGVRFRPGGVGDFFGVPLQELRDLRVPLSDLPVGPGLLAELTKAAESWPAARERPRLAEPLMAGVRPAHLADAPVARHSPLDEAVLPGLRAGLEARLQLLQAAVGRRLSAAAGPASVDPAAPAITTALGRGRSVAEVARDLGYSERQLHRRSLLAFGYAPKTLQRIVRFQHALRLARAGTPLAEVAVTAGYSDQAHLSNDVKRLSGVQLSRLL
ncbi:AraC family transcriptional regulator [Nonomuraea sp. NPDC050202]|uniref:AraC family transcriptional regulator n=1 Tax=Nonomuraea sp. NPDC050202 TaxID=3155035 RepID=UPI0033CCC98F